MVVGRSSLLLMDLGNPVGRMSCRSLLLLAGMLQSPLALLVTAGKLIPGSPSSQRDVDCYNHLERSEYLLSLQCEWHCHEGAYQSTSTL